MSVAKWSPERLPEWHDEGVALARPEGISDQHWDSIEAHQARLDRACERGDRSGIVGAAKELCECVASVVCAEQAQTISTADDFGKLISAAHTALDRRPGRGAAIEGSVQLIAQTARTIVAALNSLRNEVGTGHGRPVTPVVTRETAAIAEHSARLWSAWALGRLDEVLRGEVPRLIHELEAGGNWRRGLLAQRFAEVGLQSLHSEDQRRIGVAVARRASGGGTFVVSEAGVRPLRWDAEAWPAAYSDGVAAGLLLDDSGRLTLRKGFVEDLAAIVAVMNVDEWCQLADQAVTALWAPDLAGDSERQRELADFIDSLWPTLDDDRRRTWVLLAERLRNWTDTGMQEE
jgi:hypothetical protein